MRLVSFADKAWALNDPNRRAGLEDADLRDKKVCVLVGSEVIEVVSIEFDKENDIILISLQ